MPSPLTSAAVIAATRGSLTEPAVRETAIRAGSGRPAGRPGRRGAPRRAHLRHRDRPTRSRGLSRHCRTAPGHEHVPSPLFRRTARSTVGPRGDEIEVAVGVDVRGPGSQERSRCREAASTRRSPLRKRPVVHLTEDLQPSTGEDEIGSEVVVQIRERHLHRDRARRAMSRPPSCRLRGAALSGRQPRGPADRRP